MGIEGPDTVPGRDFNAVSRLAAIVESSGDAILSKTLEGVITSWNAGAAHMYGYAPDEIVGHIVPDLIPPDRAGELEATSAGCGGGRRSSISRPSAVVRTAASSMCRCVSPRSGIRPVRWWRRPPWPGT